MIDALQGEYKDRYMFHYNFPPYSTGETGRVGTPKRREIGHGRLAKRALAAVLPTEAVEMMKHQPQELRNNFERLWNNQHKRNVKIPATTDRVTRSMTTRGNVKALIAKSTRLKVKDVLKSQHSAKWVEAINIEVNSLINNFKCLIPEEIN